MRCIVDVQCVIIFFDASLSLRELFMSEEVKNPLEYFKDAYSKYFPLFMGDLLEAGGDFKALSSATANLCGAVLGLSRIPHSISVVFYNRKDFSNKLSSSYFMSNVVSEDEFEVALEFVIRFLSLNPTNTTESYVYSEINKTIIYGVQNPDSVLIIPIRTASDTCGYTIVFFHDNTNRCEVDSMNVTFVSKVLYLVALSVQCELNESMLEHYLMNDYLTGLPNRDHIYEAIIYMLQTAEAFGQRFAIVVIRINGLKSINNSLGIITGDLMLKEVGSLIEKTVGANIEFSTLVGRLGGGDFIVLITLPEYNREESDDEDVIVKCCNAIIAETEKHVEINGYNLYPSVNIGASLYPFHGETVEELLRKAELAKNDAKVTGPGTFSIYKGFMDGDAEEILFLNSNLPTAISQNQFEMFYQAMVDVETGKVTAAEALIRWRHPERGLIFPDSFVTFAEKNAYGIQIDILVLSMACRQIIAWQEKGYDLVVSVNISPRHFMNGLIYDSVTKVIKNYNVDPSRLRIELLENILLDDFNSAIKVINDLRSTGVGVALDDFGSGYSSLEYVSQLPMDYLKIDRTFMMNMQKNPGNEVIMETILTLAKGMKVKTVAEGVERREDFDFLRKIGCDVAQGYFITRPVDVPSFEKFLDGWQLT